MHSNAPLPTDVVLLSTADWDHPFWTNKQRVALQLAEQGFRVLYVESLGLRRPTVGTRDLARIARRLKRAWRPMRKVHDNLWVASPLALPWHSQRWARHLNDVWLERWLGRQCRRLGFQTPIVWTYNPLLEPLARQLGGSLLVYHCVDDLTAAPHLPAFAIERAQRELARRADVVFTTSNALHAQMSALNPTRTYFLPNVADYDHFAQAREVGPVPPELAAIPRPRIGFVGALSRYKFDFELVARVARARPAWHWVLIGQMGEGQPETTFDFGSLPNVQVLGARPYAQLPEYLRGFDAATIPAPANPYTAAMFPMKFFEYLAAGLPVIASNVPALEPYREACALVQDEPQFVAALDRALTGDGEQRQRGIELAQRFTWKWRMQEMLAILRRAWESRAVSAETVSAETASEEIVEQSALRSRAG